MKFSVVFCELVNQQGNHDEEDDQAEDGAEDPASDDTFGDVRTDEPEDRVENQKNRSGVIKFCLLMNLDFSIDRRALRIVVAHDEEALLLGLAGEVARVDGAKSVIKKGLISGSSRIGATTNSHKLSKKSSDETNQRVDEFHWRVHQVEGIAIAATNRFGFAEARFDLVRLLDIRAGVVPGRKSDGESTVGVAEIDVRMRSSGDRFLCLLVDDHDEIHLTGPGETVRFSIEEAKKRHGLLVHAFLGFGDVESIGNEDAEKIDRADTMSEDGSQRETNSTEESADNRK